MSGEHVPETDEQRVWADKFDSCLLEGCLETLGCLWVVSCLAFVVIVPIWMK